MLQWTMGVLVTLAVTLLTTWPALADEAVFKNGKWVAAAAPKIGTPEGELALARKCLEEGRPHEALKQANKIVAAYPDNDEAVEEAMCLAGDAQMARNKYWKAFGLYEKQIARFPMGKLLDRALAREAEIADAFLAGKKRWVLGIFRVSAEDDGMTIHERIAERVPGTKLASESIMNVADYLYGRRRWAEATQAYDRYREMFAGRYLTEQAELQATRAVYASFAGVAYDDTPLVEAEQRYKAFLTRYPHSDGAKEAAAALVEIEQAKARKDYETGRFYARTGRKIPAAFYYRQVVQLYPGTIWAEKSAAALSSLAPADPNQAQGGAVTNKVGAG